MLIFADIYVLPNYEYFLFWTKAVARADLLKLRRVKWVMS